MRRTIENGFELTGPIARGDWETVDAHVAAIRRRAARARGDVRDARGDDEGAPVKIVRTHRGRCARSSAARRDGRPRADDGRAPRRPRAAHRRRAAGVRHRRRQPLRQPRPVRRGGRPRRLPARRGSATPRSRPRQASTSSSHRTADEIYPAGLPDVGRGRGALARPRGRVPAGALPRRRHRLPASSSTSSGRSCAYFGQKDAQQVAVIRRMVATSTSSLTCASCRRCATPTGSPLSSRNAHLSPAERERALALPRALATRDAGRRPRRTRRPRRRLRRGRRLRPARSRRRRPRRLDPTDRQRHPRTRRNDDHPPAQARSRHARPREARR